MAPLTGTFERERRGAPPFIAARALPLPCTQVVVRRVFGQKGEESPPDPWRGGRGRREEDFYGLLGGEKGGELRGRGGKDRVPAIRGQGWVSTMVSKEKQKKNKTIF